MYIYICAHITIISLSFPYHIISYTSNPPTQRPRDLSHLAPVANKKGASHLPDQWIRNRSQSQGDDWWGFPPTAAVGKFGPNWKGISFLITSKKKDNIQSEFYGNSPTYDNFGRYSWPNPIIYMAKLSHDIPMAALDPVCLYIISSFNHHMSQQMQWIYPLVIKHSGKIPVASPWRFQKGNSSN